MMNDKHWQAKAVIDYLNEAEINKLLRYCRRHFPHVFKRTKSSEADSVKAVEAALANVRSGKAFNLKKVLDKIEYDVIHRTLVKFKKQTRAADFLGLKEQTLRYKMIRLKIPTIRLNQMYYMESENEEEAE
jgi:DNA-binding NtrC family response regulator